MAALLNSPRWSQTTRVCLVFSLFHAFPDGLPWTFIKKSANKQIKTDMEIGFMRQLPFRIVFGEGEKNRYRQVRG
jgi:hypothetical protein